jgi:PKD repeat protein
VQHTYAREGTYTVSVTASTVDGRTSATRGHVIVVENHDVTITKLTAPQSGRVGQTRQVSVGINSKLREETVTVVLYKSAAGAQDGFAEIGRLTQVVPVRSANRTTAFDFSYTFSEADAAMGTITFKAVAAIAGRLDAVPADNTAISLPVKVSGDKTNSTVDEAGMLYLPMVAGE